MKPGIVGWGFYVPRYRIRVEEVAKQWGADPRQIMEGLGIAEKAVPGEDEDAATIAVEAARMALSSSAIDKHKLGAVFVGSESHPYAVKPTGTIVAAALQLGEEMMVADLSFACKAGTAGIQILLGMVSSGMIEAGIAGGADVAQARPGDALEYAAGAGGAMFVIGKGDVAAVINHTCSVATDTPDFWRRQHSRHPYHTGPFTGEPAYFYHVEKAAKLVMERAGTKPEDYDYAVFHQPNAKFPSRVAKRLGFSHEQTSQGLVVKEIGNAYAASSLLGLCAVLQAAKPGDRILLASYGSGAGADAFDIEATDRILEARKKIPEFASLIKNREYVGYSEYLKMRGELR